MNFLKEKVISYLNMGINPTVIGFADDGLYYLFDKLLKGTQQSNGYDPTYSFIHIALNSLPVLDPLYIENGINERLIRDEFPGDNVYETISHNIETVCILDDLALLKEPEKAIEIADSFYRKYRGKLKFVFLAEDPMFLNKIKNKVNPASIVFEGIIYQKIEMDWSVESLRDTLSNQYHTEISLEKILESKTLTNGHFGLTKRKIQDEIAKTDSFERYAKLLIENFDEKALNVFKKINKQIELSVEENEILENYKNVGFIKDNQINIPVIKDLIENIIIFKNIDLTEENKLTGLDLNLLNVKEREIIETLLKTHSVVKKEDIGKIIWKDEFKNKYSEWALDQRIARLRKKIIDLGFNIDIQTIYGKGYRLNKLTTK